MIQREHRRRNDAWYGGERVRACVQERRQRIEPPRARSRVAPRGCHAAPPLHRQARAATE